MKRNRINAAKLFDSVTEWTFVVYHLSDLFFFSRFVMAHRVMEDCRTSVLSGFEKANVAWRNRSTSPTHQLFSSQRLP